jgi:hypothetical protein
MRINNELFFYEFKFNFMFKNNFFLMRSKSKKNIVNFVEIIFN